MIPTVSAYEEQELHVEGEAAFLQLSGELAYVCLSLLLFSRTHTPSGTVLGWMCVGARVSRNGPGLCHQCFLIAKLSDHPEPGPYPLLTSCPEPQSSRVQQGPRRDELIHTSAGDLHRGQGFPLPRALLGSCSLFLGLPLCLLLILCPCNVVDPQCPRGSAKSTH